MRVKILMQFVLLILVTLSSQAMDYPSPQKSPLKVLFVGYDPAKPMPEIKRSAPGMMSAEEFKAEYPIRMPAFKTLLDQYFSIVKTIDCRDWKAADSEPYDVTIFDFPTTRLEEEKTETDADGKMIKYTSPKYLSENFSKPVIFIAGTADQMGRTIGLKIDWLCLCLDADAHHLNTGHAIFKGPLEKVVPTMETKKTPEDIYHYASGAGVPKELPMWRVQKTGFMDGKGARVGLVSRGNRFLESPDTEMISSGVCQKDVGAVALGRHGNFFLWGFGASPADMTDEAKKVFVNTVAYMKRFDGKTPIARKYNDRMATTDDVREMVAETTGKSYESYVAGIKDYNKNNEDRFKRLNDKKAKGEKLTSEEEMSLEYSGRVEEIKSWEDYLKEKMGKYASKFGNDAEAFQRYMKDNSGYVYCNPEGFFDYSIDEDVQQIGISNHEVKMLDACVVMLKKNDRSELALRVLKKYTGENFQSAEEWNNWISKNRKKLFFSETNGYKFTINTYN